MCKTVYRVSKGHPVWAYASARIVLPAHVLRHKSGVTTHEPGLAQQRMSWPILITQSR
jgi:hypothetical protein